MIPSRRGLLGTPVLALVFFSLPPFAPGAGDDEVAPDVPRAAEPGPFHPPVRLAADGGVIDAGPVWGHASPWVADADGDGIRDLVVGDFSGLFRVYRNAGTDREPRYEKAVNLKAGGVDAKVPIY